MLLPAPPPESQQGGCGVHAGMALRYSAQFPDRVWARLAALVAGRPFPTGATLRPADASPAAVHVAGSELACRGFRVAEAEQPVAGRAPALRLPGGCADVVACVPGPRELHAPELLAEARRLMAADGYLAVAWNDRDLSHPFVVDLERLLERINPAYCRSSRQHNPAAVMAALSDGGALQLVSFTSHSHGLACARAGVLQDLLGGFAVARPHLAASSSHRKDFHQEVRALVRAHFGDDEAPFELPLVSKLFVLRKAHARPAAGAADKQCGCFDGDDVSLLQHVRMRRQCRSRDSCRLTASVD